jgi:RNA polymerase sigma-70 factor (ECF subfamily)
MGQLEEEQDWIRQSREGNHESFAALIARYQRMVHSLTFRMTGSLADGEDLAQETFILAFRRLDSFRGESKFSSWLCQIAVNTCLNWKKRQTRRERTHQDWAEHEQVSGGTCATLSEAEEEGTRRVQAALLKLSPKQRAAIVLTVYEGMNHAEAARILGCSETTVSWRLFAARAKLKRLLKTSHD